MSFNFPNDPVIDQIYVPPGGTTYKFNGYGWSQVTTASSGGVEEAPVDGQQYARSDAAWEIVAASGGGVTDGDKGDIVVSGSGAMWLFDSTVVTAAAKTVLDDASVPAMLATLGGLPSASYTAADVLAKVKTVDGVGSGLDADLLDGNDSAFYATAAALSGKEPTIAGGTTAQYWRGDKSWQTLPASGIADAPNDASAYVRSGLAWVIGYTKTAIDTLLGGKVAKTGDTMTGGLTIAPAADHSSLTMNAPAGSSSIIYMNRTNDTDNNWIVGSKGGAGRWTIVPGSNDAAASFQLNRHNDAGTYLATAMVVDRATGEVTLPTGANGAKQLFVTGVNKGVRFGFNTTTSLIEGVDNASSTYQPLTLGGSAVYGPTVAATTNDTQLATTAFVKANLPVKVTVASSAPGSPATNDVWIDTT